jgi:hypothetical protein
MTNLDYKINRIHVSYSRIPNGKHTNGIWTAFVPLPFSGKLVIQREDRLDAVGAMVENLISAGLSLARTITIATDASKL